MPGFLMADAASVRRGTARWAPHVRSFAAANARELHKPWHLITRMAS